MTPEEKRRFELRVLLRKVHACMTRPIPERGAAVAAIDYYLSLRGESIQLEDNSHMDDLGLRSRTCEMIENTLGIWTVGDLRKLDRETFLATPLLGDGMLMEIIAALDRYGLPHRLSPSGTAGSSTGGSRDDEADPMDQLLDSWLVGTGS